MKNHKQLTIEISASPHSSPLSATKNPPHPPNNDNDNDAGEINAKISETLKLLAKALREYRL